MMAVLDSFCERFLGVNVVDTAKAALYVPR